MVLMSSGVLCRSIARLIVLQVWLSDLHEEPRAERPSDVDVVVLGGEVGRGALQVEPVHDAAQLQGRGAIQ